MKAGKKIRVLIVDDSAIARDLLERGLSMDPEIQVAGKASDAWSARDKIVLLKPDVITLDVEMPRMDGIEFVKRLLPQYPIPVVIVSAVTLEGSRRALEAMSAGAVEVVGKPEASDREGLMRMISDLTAKIKEAAKADIAKQLTRPQGASVQKHAPRPALAAGGPRRIIAIGASTGGTAVLNTLIPQFPPNMPGTVIVQHMPPVFTRLFADALNKTSQVEVREAATGDVVKPGLVLIAPGDFQMTVRKNGLEWVVQCSPGEKVSGHRPSVDVLFNSVAKTAGERAIGLLLTGMGRDGADGLLAMRKSGARCFTQSQASSVVYGMPKEAVDIGASERSLDIPQMTQQILSCLQAADPARSIS